MKTRGDELRAYLFAKRLDELGSGLRRTSYRDLDAAGAVAREPGVGASMLSEDIFGARNLMSALCRVGPTSPSRHVLRAESCDEQDGHDRGDNDQNCCAGSHVGFLCWLRGINGRRAASQSFVWPRGEES
jgi:hypothetical protein